MCVFVCLCLSHSLFFSVCVSECEIALSDIWMKEVIHFPTQAANTAPSLTITLSLLLPWCFPHFSFHFFFLFLHLSSSLPSLLACSYTVFWHHPQALLHPGFIYVCMHVNVCVCVCPKFPDAAFSAEGGHLIGPLTSWPWRLAYTYATNTTVALHSVSLPWGFVNVGGRNDLRKCVLVLFFNV